MDVGGDGDGDGNDSGGRGGPKTDGFLRRERARRGARRQTRQSVTCRVDAALAHVLQSVIGLLFLPERQKTPSRQRLA